MCASHLWFECLWVWILAIYFKKSLGGCSYALKKYPSTQLKRTHKLNILGKFQAFIHPIIFWLHYISKRQTPSQIFMVLSWPKYWISVAYKDCSWKLFACKFQLDLMDSLYHDSSFCHQFQFQMAHWLYNTYFKRDYIMILVRDDFWVLSKKVF